MSRTSIALVLALFVAPVLPACALQNGQEVDEPTVQADDELSLTRGRFETFEGKDGKHYFHLLAGNGEKVLASEGYSSLEAAQAGIRSVQSNGAAVTGYEVREAKTGEFYFVAKAGNGAVIGMSELYVSQANAERGLATVAKIVKATTAVSTAPEGTPHFQVFRGLDKQYYFHLRANNGEIVLQSEGYVSRSGAVSGQASVSLNGKDARRFVLIEAISGEWYFVLKAGNGQTVAKSETYSSKSNATAAIKSIVTLLGGTVVSAS